MNLTKVLVGVRTTHVRITTALTLMLIHQYRSLNPVSFMKSLQIK